MRKIKIGFSSSRKAFPIFGRLIQLVQKTEFSHVYVRSQTKYGVDLIYQASGVSVNFMSSEVFEGHNKIVKEFEFDIDEKSFDSYMKYALSNVGKPYSVSQIIGITIALVFNLKNNPLGDKDSGFVCSELVYDILKSIFKETEIADADRVTPKDIWNFCLLADKRVTK